MRVLTFTTLFPNSVQTSHGLFVRERVEAMAKILDVSVVAPVPWFPRIKVLGERYYAYSLIPRHEKIGGLDVEHPRFPAIPKFGKALDGLLLALGTIGRIRRLHKKRPFQIIDSHWAFPDGVAAVLLAVWMRVPCAITVRGDDINIFLREFWRGPWIRWALRRADLVIAVSHELKQIVLMAGVPPSRIAVVPNGINPENFHLVEKAEARLRLGLPEGRRIVLSVGRLHQSKGYPVLVDAVGRLSSRFPDVDIYIIGSPDHEADPRPAIYESAARHMMHDRLRLVGAQDSKLLKYWYSAADLFCLPTVREGSANVLIEAIACGLPCVTTSVGGNPDVICNDSLGILAAPDVHSIADALAIALCKDWDRKAIAMQGKHRTWQRVAEECKTHFLASIVSRMPSPGNAE